MIKKIILLFLLALSVMALKIPELTLSESLSEKKRGLEFLQFIWDSHLIVEDIEAQTYIKKLGYELIKHSKNPNKHFDFFLINDNNINAFAGPYGYIGVHTGMLLTASSEAELAGVLAHEISHVTQNHLQRFNKKTDKQGYLLLAGILAATLTKDKNASEAIVTSTLAGAAQQNINFTREHEWEADRIGTALLSKSGFDPQGMAHFFAKLKDNAHAEEFLQSHPLSINRIADSAQRAERIGGKYRQDSFAYLTMRGRLYYHQYNRIEAQKDPALNYYMQAYQAFAQQEYKTAQHFVNQLLAINSTSPSVILAGRIAGKLGDIKLSRQYFDKNKNDEASIYYAAQAYLNQQKPEVGVSLLSPFLKNHTATPQSYQLLSSLYVRYGKLDKAHIASAEKLILQGKWHAALAQYQRAKSITNNQDLFDILTARMDKLQQNIDLYEK